MNTDHDKGLDPTCDQKNEEACEQAERPTPITDAFARQWHTVEEMLAFARDLERQLAEARENLEITQREWVTAKAERVEALRERDAAREELREWKNAAASAENPCADEVHCSCVPLLKTSLAAERALADRLADAVACLTAETPQGYDHIQSAFNAWKEARKQ